MKEIHKMKRVEVPAFRLELPNLGVFYCQTMTVVYNIIQDYYPELFRSKKLREGKKTIGDRRVIKLPSGGEITLVVIPLLKMEGRAYHGRKDLGNVESKSAETQK